MADPAKEPAVPRLAATMVLVRDDPLEVLMVKRHEKATFASALVYPGGTVDPEDYSDDWLPHLIGHEDLDPAERALRIAAIRETWEETQVLVAKRVTARLCRLANSTLTSRSSISYARPNCCSTWEP